MFALHLFGVVHIDRLGKVRSELASYLDDTDADALFLETQPVEPRAYLRGLLHTPLSLFGFLLYGMVLAPLLVLCTRRYAPPELVAASDLAERREIPLHTVDRPLPEFARERPLWRTVVEWVVFLALLALDPVSNGLLVAYVSIAMGAVVGAVRVGRRLAGPVAFLAGSGAVVLLVGPGPVVRSTYSLWFFFVAVVANAVFVFQTLDARNEYMTERAAELAEREGYERGVLVTGRAHLDGMCSVSEHVARVYRPRWLRAPGRVETESEREDASDDPVPLGRPASIRSRAGAALVDAGAATIAAVGGAVMAAYIEDLFASLVGVEFEAFALAVGLVGALCVYFGGLEAVYGQTVGKRAVGIVVTDEDGAPPTGRRVFVRNAFRPIDFLVCYLLGAFVAALTQERQRLGDLLAGTVVRETVSESAD